MNKTILAILTCVILYSCNNAGDSEKKAGDSSNTVTKDELKADGPLAACNKMIFFKPGAEVETGSYDGDGKLKGKQTTKILSVSNEDGFAVAQAQATTEGDGSDSSKTVSYSYKCDGNKIYFDIASMFRTAAKNQDGTFESSFIEYPINVKEGETLPDANGKMSAEKDGKKMEMIYHYKNRKVEAKEEVTTPAGTWNCFKISNSVEVEMNIPGMDEKTKALMKQMQGAMRTTSITWFAPDFGIVKFELYVNGNIQAKNQVTAVK